MKLSLYGQYILERQGRGSLETEFGFVTFDYLTSEIVYVADVYVVPEKREQNYGNEMLATVVTQAYKDGRTQLMSSVDLRDKNAERSVKIMEKQGAKLFKVEEPMAYYIMMIKDLIDVTDIEVTVNKETEVA